MAESRLKNSFNNLVSGFVSRFIILLLGLIVRTIFVKVLGNSYLSVNGLYSNILSMLSLAELGFGTAMVYNMYKPIVENDSNKLAALMDLYKKVYRIIGFVILALGLAIIPFMDYIIKDPPNIDHLTLYYILFLLNTVLSYWFFAYKRSILNADQKEYIATNYKSIFTIVKSVLQIIVLIVFKDFLFYLATQMICTIAENIAIAKKTKKLYPQISNKNHPSLTKAELKKIWDDVKALMISKIGHVILNSTDNIIISAFVGVSWVGLLSNFALIIDSVTTVICQITSSFTASLGNYFVKENSENSYTLFERIEFLLSWLYGICSIFLFILLNPFITIWLGTEYTLSNSIVFALCLNFFVQGYMNNLWNFRSTLGLFTQGKYRPLIATLINVTFSILLGIKFGTFGVLFATFLSRASINLWYDPIIIHKYGFGKSAKKFFINYLFRIIQVFIISAILFGIKTLITRNGTSILSFIILMIISVIITFVMFWIFAHRSKEYHFFMELFKTKFVIPIKNKLK